MIIKSESGPLLLVLILALVSMHVPLNLLMFNGLHIIGRCGGSRSIPLVDSRGRLVLALEAQALLD